MRDDPEGSFSGVELGGIRLQLLESSGHAVDRGSFDPTGTRIRQWRSLAVAYVSSVILHHYKYASNSLVALVINKYLYMISKHVF